jgi:O-antigen/teichoic acid export membrane protein
MGVGRRYILFLFPSIFRVALSFVALPFATRILDATDYGLYGLALSVTLLGLTVAIPSIGPMMAYHFINRPLDEQQQVVSALTIFGVTTIGLFSIGLVALWPTLLWIAPSLTAISMNWLILALLSLVMVVPWQIATQVLTLQKTAWPFALVTTLEALVGSTTLLIGLYVFGLGIGALFWSGFMAAVVNLTGAIWNLRGFFQLKVERIWFRRIMAYLPSAFGSQFAERGKNTITGVLMTSFLGPAQFGLFDHSRRYQQLVLNYTRAASNTIYPTSLEEVHIEPYDFKRTRTAWDAVHIGTITFALGFAAVGREFLMVISNDVFTDAYIYVPVWMILILIQLMARPHYATMMAHERGAYLFWLDGVTQIIGIVFLVLLIPVIGVWGVFVSEGIRLVAYRWHMIRSAKPYRAVGFVDHWILIGTGLIGVMLLLVTQFDLSLIQRTILFVIAETALLIGAAPVLKSVLQYIRPKTT